MMKYLNRKNKTAAVIGGFFHFRYCNVPIINTITLVVTDMLTVAITDPNSETRLYSALTGSVIYFFVVIFDFSCDCFKKTENYGIGNFDILVRIKYRNPYLFAVLNSFEEEDDDENSDEIFLP